MTGTDVFISYARADGDVGPFVARTLTSLGVQAWLDKSEILAGSWREEIAQGIRDAKAFVPILSAQSLSRPVVLQEINYASDLSKPIVPVYLDPPESLNQPESVGLVLAGQQFTMFDRQEPAASVDRLLAALQRLGIGPGPERDGAGHLNQRVNAPALWPEFDTSWLLDEAKTRALCQQFDDACRLRSDNAMNWLNRGVMWLHVGNREIGLESCTRAHQLDPGNSDTAHYLNVAQLFHTPARRLNLRQVEKIEQRALDSYQRNGDGRDLLPLAVIANDYRAPFGHRLIYGTAVQLAARAVAEASDLREVRRFQSIVPLELKERD